jgi:hypothetical protein
MAIFAVKIMDYGKQEEPLCRKGKKHCEEEDIGKESRKIEAREG